MIYLYIIFFTSGFIYLLYIYSFLKGLAKLPNSSVINSNDNELPEITIIVPARNEEDNIERTVISLLYQDYPNDKFTIIAVNDRSKDRTGEILNSLKENTSNFDVIHITEVSKDISPKKNAILKAVEAAKTEYIITTDGDCLHNKQWLRSMVNPILRNKSKNIGVIAGLTVFYKEKYSSISEMIWQKMQNIDYISHSLLAAGAIGNNKGFTANGSNLLVKKELYADSSDVRSDVISGDDFFIIQKAAEKGYGIRFSLSDESIVKSYPVDTVEDLFEQRARWSSKTGRSSRYVLYFAINTFILYSSIMLMFILGFFNREMFVIFLCLLSIKIIPETVFMIYGFGRLGLNFQFRYYLLLQLFHIPFNILAALKGKFLGFRWKGVKYK